MDSLSKKIITAIQGDIPLTREPYRELAREVGISQEELLNRLTQMKKDGLLKRVGAILHHRRSGFVANALVAWCVPEEIVEDIGHLMASYTEASHVYQRPSHAGWPYNIYTMIHSTSREKCEKVVKKISMDSGIKDYLILYSTREFKKTSMKYYAD